MALDLVKMKAEIGILKRVLRRGGKPNDIEVKREKDTDRDIGRLQER